MSKYKKKHSKHAIIHKEHIREFKITIEGTSLEIVVK